MAQPDAEQEQLEETPLAPTAPQDTGNTGDTGDAQPEAEASPSPEGAGEPDGESTPAPQTEDTETLRAELEEMRGRWQRAQADYQNLKRRSQSDLEGMLRRNMQPLLESLLLVTDHLDMALSSAPSTGEGQALAAGVQMIGGQLGRALEDEDVRAIAEEGEFDPELHQAVATTPEAGTEAGTILETLRRGYTWRGIVLRHAQVRVAAPAEEDATPDAAPGEGLEEPPAGG